MLLTVLANDVQPFIRYDLGDCLRFYKDPCPCGSPFTIPATPGTAWASSTRRAACCAGHRRAVQSEQLFGLGFE